MVNWGLVNYIKGLLSRGYNIDYIRNYLVNYGYPPQIVDEAIHFIYYGNQNYSYQGYYQQPSQVKHEINLSKQTVVAVLAIFLGLAIIVSSIFFIFSYDNTPKQLLDIKIDIHTLSFENTADLKFTTTLSNLGNLKRYDVTLYHEILDSEENSIKTKEETIAVETKAATDSTINLPDDTPPGTYILKTTAYYAGKKASASESFKIIEESESETCFDGIKNQDETDVDCDGVCEACPTCFDNIKNQGEDDVDCGGPCEDCKEEVIIEQGTCPESCDDDNICTKDYCDETTDFKCEHEKLKPCCGDGKCESEEENSCIADCEGANPFIGLNIFEQISKIEELAVTDAENAVSYCEMIAQETYQDQCLLKVGKIDENIKICEKITNDRQKDDCYTAVAKSKKDSELCTLISKQSRIDACYSSFFMEDDFTVCDKIQNSYLKQSCESLKQVKEARG